MTRRQLDQVCREIRSAFIFAVLPLALSVFLLRRRWRFA